MNNFFESVAKTNNLICDDCKENIEAGDFIIYELAHGKIKNVYCSVCSSEYEDKLEDYEKRPLISG